MSLCLSIYIENRWYVIRIYVYNIIFNVTYTYIHTYIHTYVPADMIPMNVLLPINSCSYTCYICSYVHKY